MWIKKIEKSNQPFFIQPKLYRDIKMYIDMAYRFDYNLVVEEFPFFYQITPKLQTELIQQTQYFKRFERNFSHFFEECEQGFINEFIVELFCRIFLPGRPVISYKSSVKAMYFIMTGRVDVFNHENDELRKKDPVLYLPKYSYFGDYQILYNLKSNLDFKTMEQPSANSAADDGEPESVNLQDQDKNDDDFRPDSSSSPGDGTSIYFMCIEKDKLLYLCDIFPQTAENIKRRSKERRLRFMLQRNSNSQKWTRQQARLRE